MDAWEDVSGDLPDGPFVLGQYLSGPHENFHYLIGDPETKQAAVIDPAFHLDRLFAAAAAAGVRVREAWFTHGHWDHIGGIPEIFEHSVETVRIHAAAKGHAKVQEAGGRVRLFDDGEVLGLGALSVEALHTPGHQPESTCFLTRTDPPALFGGDTLFIGSCGRTDFPGGDTDAMHASMARLRGVPDATVILPGHHYAEHAWRRMGDERRDNPALATTDPVAFGRLYCLTH